MWLLCGVQSTTSGPSAEEVLFSLYFYFLYNICLLIIHLFIDTGTLMDLKITEKKLGWFSSELKRSPCLFLPSACIIDACAIFEILQGF